MAEADGRLRPVARIYVSAQLVPAALLIAFLIGSLLLSGGQVNADQSPNWDAVVPFPIFPVPAWLLIALGAVGLIAAILWAVRSTAAESRSLTGAFGATAAAFVASMFFGLAFLTDPVWSGPYWIGMVLAVLSGGLLLIVGVIRGRRSSAAAASPLKERS